MILESLFGLGGLGVASTVFIAQYKRCSSNQILVVFGKTGSKSAQSYHGGGKFVIPILQDYGYLSLHPMVADIDLKGALSKTNIRINIPSTFTFAVSTKDELMQNAAERLLDFSEKEIVEQARDIIFGQLRLVAATLTIEEINQDREKFLNQINTNVEEELNKIGLSLINVNITDITDESGYIEAIGKKAASEAINKARVEVAQQEQFGATGEAKAVRGREVEVAQQMAQTNIGQVGAEQERRIKTAELNATAVEGENTSKMVIAETNAQLKIKEAETMRKGDIAKAEAEKAVAEAQKLTEKARLEKEEVVREEIEKQKIAVQAEAEAERIRRIAQGEADAVKAKYYAEADGIEKVLKAQADGYKKLVEAAGGNPAMANGYLMLDKIEPIIKEQVKALENLKIDKLTIWDSGNSSGKDGQGLISGLARDIMGTIPQMQDLAKQAGIQLPTVFGSMVDGKEVVGAVDQNTSINNSKPDWFKKQLDDGGEIIND